MNARQLCFVMNSGRKARQNFARVTTVMDWLEYENKAYELGFDVICGVDEAGRGPLAGPVCLRQLYCRGVI